MSYLTVLVGFLVKALPKYESTTKFIETIEFEILEGINL